MKARKIVALLFAAALFATIAVPAIIACATLGYRDQLVDLFWWLVQAVLGFFLDRFLHTLFRSQAT